MCHCVACVQILPIDFGEPARGDEWTSKGVADEQPDLSVFGSGSKGERPAEAYSSGAGVAEVRKEFSAAGTKCRSALGKAARGEQQ